jgi:hypothetical protein
MDSSSTKSLERLAYVLDDLVRIPGTNMRVGVDALIGLLPGGGDVAGGIMSAYTLVVATRLGAPPSVLLRMAANVLTDMIVGAVPLLGDLFDAGWKANRRNVALLRRYLDKPAPVRRSSRALVVVLLIAVAAVATTAAIVSVLLFRWLFSLL